jgi:hypothetical protein
VKELEDLKQGNRQRLVGIHQLLKMADFAREQGDPEFAELCAREAARMQGAYDVDAELIRVGEQALPAWRENPHLTLGEILQHKAER